MARATHTTWAVNTMRAAIAALLCTAACAHAGTFEWVTTPDAKLATMRGGFAAAPGLLVSFGIVRSVEVDGQLVARTALQVPDLSSLTALQAQQLSQQVAQLGIVQAGRGNAASLPADNGALPLVIQNTMNDRQIRSLTEINAASNGMGLLKELNLSRTLADALGAAVAR
jgi:hypothetical protein